MGKEQERRQLVDETMFRCYEHVLGYRWDGPLVYECTVTDGAR
jgi:hypothetical protein